MPTPLQLKRKRLIKKARDLSVKLNKALDDLRYSSDDVMYNEAHSILMFLTEQ